MRFRPADQRARRTADTRCEPAHDDRFALGVSLPPATEFRQRIRRSLRVVGGRVSSAAVTELAGVFLRERSMQLELYRGLAYDYANGQITRRTLKELSHSEGPFGEQEPLLVPDRSSR